MPPKKGTTTPGAHGAQGLAPPCPGSFEEFEQLLALRVTLLGAAHKQPDVETFRKQLEENMVALQKSLRARGEMIKAFTICLVDPSALSGQQGLGLIRIRDAVVKQNEFVSRHNEAGAGVESLNDSIGMKEPGDVAVAFAKLFIDPEEAFATKEDL
jgi:hypothetical protein